MRLQILARKNFQGFNGILTHGLCVSAAVFYRLSYEDQWVGSRPVFRVHLYQWKEWDVEWSRFELREYRWERNDEMRWEIDNWPTWIVKTLRMCTLGRLWRTHKLLGKVTVSTKIIFRWNSLKRYVERRFRGMRRLMNVTVGMNSA